MRVLFVYMNMFTYLCLINSKKVCWVYSFIISFLREKTIIMEIENINLIRELNLTEYQVHKIVLEWYTNGMCPDIWQNEDGHDLEEYLEPIVY